MNKPNSFLSLHLNNTRCEYEDANIARGSTYPFVGIGLEPNVTSTKILEGIRGTDHD